MEKLGLWSTSQLSLWKWSLHLKIGVVFPLSILWGCILYTNTLCNKHCLMILPLFVAIYEIWLPRLTYGVYLVLFLKPGATTMMLATVKDPRHRQWYYHFRFVVSTGSDRLHKKLHNSLIWCPIKMNFIPKLWYFWRSKTL